MSQREAYKNAYNPKKMKDKSIDERACKTLKIAKVKSRYEELLEKTRNREEEKTIISVEESKKWLTDIIYGKVKDTNIMKVGDMPVPVDVDVKLTDKLKALDILNKMRGEYIERRENTVSLNYEEKLKKVVDEDEY